MVPGKGIEPLTRSLQGCRSATELDRLIWWNPMESNHLLMLFRHPREPSTPEFQIQKNPQRGGLLEVNYLQALYSIIRSIQDSFMQSQH